MKAPSFFIAHEDESGMVLEYRYSRPHVQVGIVYVNEFFFNNVVVQKRKTKKNDLKLFELSYSFNNAFIRFFY